MKTRVFTLLAFLVTLALLFGPALAGALAKGSTASAPQRTRDEADDTAPAPFSAFGTASASAAVQSSGSNWRIEYVDCPKQFSDMTDRSLRLDDGDHPHIAYGGKHLYYAWHDGAQWHYETVDEAYNVGRHASLALDGSDRPHISYYDSANGDLKYARHDGTGWHIETVPTGNAGGWYTSLALDGMGRPHISCPGYFAVLYYAWHDGTTWHIETVTFQYHGTIQDTSLALDGAGRPHISYQYDRFGVLYYAWHDGTTWHVETVDSGGYVQDTSLALDSLDRPHISYYDSRTDDLKYAWHDGTTWHIERVDTRGEYVSLALDEVDQPHISYYNSYDGALKYAWHDGTVWHIETVGSTGWMDGNTSLALDRAGLPHISYHDENIYALKYARQLSPLVLNKQATPQDGLRNSDTLTYTLTFSSEASLSVRLWDPLPANVHYVSNTIASNVTPPAAYSPTAGAVVWQGTLLTDTAYMVRFQVTPGITGTGALSLSAPIVNTAWLTDTQNDRSASATVIVNGQYFYLPLALREGYP